MTRARKNLASGIPKPGTTWERPVGTHTFYKGIFAIREGDDMLVGKSNYELYRGVDDTYQFVGDFDTFAAAAKAAVP